MLKIEISINVEIFLFILLFILIKQIKLYSIFILFILIHELTHMLVGILLGLKPKKFAIMPFGFKITFDEIKSTKNVELKKIAVAMAGPAINLIIMCIGILFNLSETIIYSNLVIALFNLIPIYPLDGGRILKSVLNIKLETKKAYKITNKVSNISIVILTALCSILILYIKNLKLIFVLAYLWYVVIKENKRYKIIKRIYGIIQKR